MSLNFLAHAFQKKSLTARASSYLLNLLHVYFYSLSVPCKQYSEPIRRPSSSDFGVVVVIDVTTKVLAAAEVDYPCVT